MNYHNPYKQEPILSLPNKTDVQKSENYRLLSDKSYLKIFLLSEGIKGWPTTNCDNKPLYEVSYLKFFAPDRPVIG